MSKYWFISRIKVSIALVLCIYRRLWNSFQFLVLVLFSCLGGLSIFSSIWQARFCFFAQSSNCQALVRVPRTVNRGERRERETGQGHFFGREVNDALSHRQLYSEAADIGEVYPCCILVKPTSPFLSLPLGNVICQPFGAI